MPGTLRIFHHTRLAITGLGRSLVIAGSLAGLLVSCSDGKTLNQKRQVNGYISISGLEYAFLIWPYGNTHSALVESGSIDLSDSIISRARSTKTRGLCLSVLFEGNFVVEDRLVNNQYGSRTHHFLLSATNLKLSQWDAKTMALVQSNGNDLPDVCMANKGEPGMAVPK